MSVRTISPLDGIRISVIFSFSLPARATVSRRRSVPLYSRRSVSYTHLLRHAFALHAKGDELGLGQTIIALGKLLAQHLGILRTNIVKAVLLKRNANALFTLGAVGCHVPKGQFKLDAGIEEVQKTAPFLKNGGLVLLSLIHISVGTFPAECCVVQRIVFS